MSDSTPTVQAIWTKRARKGPMDVADRVDLVTDQGITGDANRGGRRQVTVISREAWDDVETELGERVDPVLRRANFLVSGIDLRESRGRVLGLGTCRIRIDGETRPCNRMEEARAGLRAALEPEWRGGVHGVVVKGGSVAVGDPARLE